MNTYLMIHTHTHIYIYMHMCIYIYMYVFPDLRCPTYFKRDDILRGYRKSIVRLRTDSLHAMQKDPHLSLIASFPVEDVGPRGWCIWG